MKSFLLRTIPLLLAAVALLTLQGYQTDTHGLPASASQQPSYSLSPADLAVDHSTIQDISLEENQIFPITKGGAYRLSGSQTGQICIDAQDEIVALILDNAQLSSFNGPAVCVESAAKLVITLPDGTSSTLTDSGYYEDDPSQDACLFSNSDLTINGSGTLEVRGNYGDAIRSKDVLKILDASVSVRARGHGLRGADGVILENAAIDLQCEQNGIYTSKENKPGRGFVSISGGTVNIIVGQYGMRIAENLYMKDCTASVYGVLDDIRCQGLKQIQEGCLQ